MSGGSDEYVRPDQADQLSQGARCRDNRNLHEQGEPLIITPNGEAKAVVQDIDSYERLQETMSLLKILALGNREVEDGRVRPAADVIEEIRERRRSG